MLSSHAETWMRSSDWVSNNTGWDKLQIAVTEQGSSIDEQNRESRAMAPVETVERWFLLKMSSACSCLTINKIIAANIKLDMPVLSLAGCYVQKNKQVRWVDQTQYPMIVVASLSAVPQSCRTPLHEIMESNIEKH